jgi:hypothetical protein
MPPISAWPSASSGRPTDEHVSYLVQSYLPVTWTFDRCNILPGNSRFRLLGYDPSYTQWAPAKYSVRNYGNICTEQQRRPGRPD